MKNKGCVNGWTILAGLIFCLWIIGKISKDSGGSTNSLSSNNSSEQKMAIWHQKSDDPNSAYLIRNRFLLKELTAAFELSKLNF